MFIVITVKRHGELSVDIVVERKLDKIVFVNILDYRVYKNIVVDVGGFITLIHFERISCLVSRNENRYGLFFLG